MNDSPVATSVTASTLEDTPITITLDGADLDVGDDVVSVNVTSLPPASQGVLYLADGSTPVVAGTDYPPVNFVFIPTPNFNGAVDSIPFTVKDSVGQVSSPPATLDLSITDVNDVPLATPITVSGTEDTPVAITLGGTDVDGSITAVTITSLPPATQGILTLADGTPVVANTPLTPAQAAGLTFNPAPNFNGTTDPITFTVTDDDGTLSAPNSANITISDVNDPPVATSVSVNSSEDEVVTVNLTGTDIDGTIARVTVTTLPNPVEGVLYLADGTTPVTVNTPLTPTEAAGLVFKPEPNYNSAIFDLVQIDFTVTDNDGDSSAPASFVIDIGDVNDSPIATPVSTSTPEDTPITVTLDGTDVDIGDDVESVSVNALPPAEQGILYLADGTTPVVAGTDYAPGSFVFVPAPNFNGVVDTIPFTVKDSVGQVSSPPGTLSLSIGDVNDPPLATAISPTGDEDSPIAVNLAGTDLDGDITAVTMTNLPPASQGVLTLADGSVVTANTPLTPEEAAGLIFTPAPNFNGTVDPISFTVTDDDGVVSAGSDATITVNSVNDLPVAAPVDEAGSSNNDIPLSLTGTDIDGTIAAVTVTTLPPASQGTLLLANGTPVVAGQALTPDEAANLVFKPNLSFGGDVLIQFTVTDSEGGVSAPASIAIDVTLADVGLFEQLVTQKPIQFNPSIDEFNRYRNDIPALDLNLPEALYIQYAIRESSQVAGANSAFGMFNADAATLSQIQGLIGDLKNSSNGTDKSLFVQFAVRNQAVTTDPSIFIQNVIRQSLVESMVRNIGITSAMSSASAGFSTLFSNFELDSPARLIELLEALYETLTTDADPAYNADNIDLEPKEVVNSIASAEPQEVEAPKASNIMAMMPSTELPARTVIAAAPSFANQLQTAAKKYNYNSLKDQIN